MDRSLEPLQQLFQNNQIGGEARVHFGNIYGCARDVIDGCTEAQQLSIFRKSLYFQTIDDRRAHISSDRLDLTCPEALEWIWDTGLASWLASPNLVFWLSGKPGSGKSTIMNYISRAHETMDLLEQHGGEWMICHFFFNFREGKRIANTLEGMLRSLMLQLVDDCPEFGEKIQTMKEFPRDPSVSLPVDKLEDMIAAVLSTMDTKVLALIDGLDEHEGNQAHLVRSLLSLQSRSRMKVCFASRPEVIVSRLLEKYPKMVMHHHNDGAVKAYLQGTLRDLVSEEDLPMIQRLLDRLVNEANGVILWARFVADELSCSVPQGLSFSELELILDQLPATVELVYDRTLNKIPETGAVESAVTLSLIMAHQELDNLVVELDSRQLMVAVVTAFQDIKPSTSQIIASLSLAQFEARLHTLLGGLVELLTSQTGGFGAGLRLVHKSLLTHLRQGRWLNNKLGTTLWQHYPSDLWSIISIKTLQQTQIQGSGSQLYQKMWPEMGDSRNNSVVTISREDGLLYNHVHKSVQGDSRNNSVVTIAREDGLLYNHVHKSVQGKDWSHEYFKSLILFIAICAAQLPYSLPNVQYSDYLTELAMSCPLLALHGLGYHTAPPLCECAHHLTFSLGTILDGENYDLIYALCHKLFPYFEASYPARKTGLTSRVKDKLFKIATRFLRMQPIDGFARALELLLEDEEPHVEHLIFFIRERYSKQLPRYINRILKRRGPGLISASERIALLGGTPKSLLEWWATSSQADIEASKLRLQVLLDLGEQVTDPVGDEQSLFHFVLAVARGRVRPMGADPVICLEALIQAGKSPPSEFTDGSVIKTLKEDYGRLEKTLAAALEAEKEAPGIEIARNKIFITNIQRRYLRGFARVLRSLRPPSGPARTV